MAKFDPKAKAKKQKIVLAVLGVVLLGVLVFQAPTILGLFGGGSSEVATEPAPPPTAAPPVSPTPATPVPVTGSAQLVDSDVAPEPTEGQLVTFDRFESKDPFAQQAEEGSVGAAAAPAPSAPKESGLQEGAREFAPKAPAAPARPISTATISVNGVSSQVQPGSTFPEADPIFKLVSVKKGTAKIGIVDGTYASGSQTITLKRGGKPVTLMNTADGTTYVLRLLSVA